MNKENVVYAYNILLGHKMNAPATYYKMIEPETCK